MENGEWRMEDGELGTRNSLQSSHRSIPHCEFSVPHSPFCVVAGAGTSLHLQFLKGSWRSKLVNSGGGADNLSRRRDLDRALPRCEMILLQKQKFGHLVECDSAVFIGYSQPREIDAAGNGRRVPCCRVVSRVQCASYQRRDLTAQNVVNDQ